jgi:hypothetical protein
MTTSPMPSMFQLDDRADLSQLVAVMSLGLCTANSSSVHCDGTGIGVISKRSGHHLMERTLI